MLTFADRSSARPFHVALADSSHGADQLVGRVAAVCCHRPEEGALTERYISILWNLQEPAVNPLRETKYR